MPNLFTSLFDWIQIAQTTGTGKFYFAKNILSNNIRQIQTAFKNSFSSFELKYSIKANYYPEIIHTANELNVQFECASLFEINYLLQLQIEANKITLNTPYLTEDLIQTCIEQNILIQVDHISQLEMIGESTKTLNKNINIGIRFNLTNIEDSRFGISNEQNQIIGLLRMLNLYNHLHLKVLHTHFSGKNRNAESLTRKADEFQKLYTTYFESFPITTINIGGGFAGHIPSVLSKQLGFESPGWITYAKSISNLANTANQNNLTLMIEPGMALVADVFYFLSEVINIKKIGNRNIALLNTSTLFLKPTAHKTNLIFDVIHINSTQQKSEFELVGISCMESDILGTFTGSLSVGDLIVFKNVGAYTLSYRPNFIFAQPEIIQL